ncbi:MAG: preprotein translocase subunit SecE [Chitinophagaceae bacterium]|nr:preprotein translocase subunit SecE [Oligoflexus sp.]
MNKDDAYWLRVCYVVFFAVVAYTAWKAAGTIGVQTSWADRFDEWYGTASYVVAALVGAAATFYLFSNKERHEYFLSAIGELRKVTWPSVQETRSMTTVVAIVVGIFAVILAVFDLAWAKIFGLLLS